MTDTTDQAASGRPQGRRKAQPRPAGFRNSPSAKIVLISIVTLLLLLPTTLIWALVEERAERANEVARDIARSWGGIQQINGPYLVVPFKETYVTGDGDKQVTATDWRTAVFFPDRLDIDGEVSVEERRKSIYSLPVFLGKIALKGHFGGMEDSRFRALKGGTIDIAMDDAVLVMGIGDVAALRSEVSLRLDGGGSIPFEPGFGHLSAEFAGSTARNVLRSASPSGINAAVPASKLRSGFAFHIPLQLNGSTGIFFAPAGQTTKVALTSDWPHPGFTGAFLPETRTITDTGFSASWTIPYLARGIPNAMETSILPLQGKLLGVKFVEPVDFYQTISRSLKYAICFVSLTFLAVFVLEMRSGWSFHWMQYALVGLALVVFYVMLLALAEHVGYDLAYLLAAGAATLLNAGYVGSSLKSRTAGAIMLSVLTVIFGILFALMKEQDYALLIGSLIGFLSLAITMFATQKIDWSGAGGTQAPESAETI
ncbi:cell envelope integrity protein CreD [Rhodobacterales bacterium]|nr:cell envelope integrity protein CreD [Rhodobacterales bacterium]